jgi:hypothetical protein
LGRVPRERIKLRDGVGEVWLRGWDGLAAKVREVGDLVREHLGDGGWL